MGSVTLVVNSENLCNFLNIAKNDEVKICDVLTDGYENKKIYDKYGDCYDVVLAIPRVIL